MGASDRFSQRIPKAKIDAVSPWELRPLTGVRGAPGAAAPTAAEIREKKSGYEAGHAQGYADAMQAVQQGRVADLQRLDGVLVLLRQRLDDLSSRTADALLDLALDVAAQVLRHEVRTQAQVILPVVQEALNLVIEAHANPTIRLAPQDFGVVRDALHGDGRYQGCRFVQDPTVEPGGCRVESPHGEIDATLPTRWRRVLQTLGTAAPLPAADAAAAAGPDAPA